MIIVKTLTSNQTVIYTLVQSPGNIIKTKNYSKISHNGCEMFFNNSSAFVFQKRPIISQNCKDFPLKSKIVLQIAKFPAKLIFTSFLSVETLANISLLITASFLNCCICRPNSVRVSIASGSYEASICKQTITGQC